MAPRNAAPEDRDVRDRSDREKSDRSRRRTRIGGEGTHEQQAGPPNCPVCGRPCED